MDSMREIMSHRGYKFVEIEDEYVITDPAGEILDSYMFELNEEQFHTMVGVIEKDLGASTGGPLSPGEVQVGMLVTVLEGPHRMLLVYTPSSLSNILSSSLFGCPVRVRAVLLPYIQVELPNGFLTSLDTRLYTLMELDSRFQ